MFSDVVALGNRFRHVLLHGLAGHVGALPVQAGAEDSGAFPVQAGTGDGVGFGARLCLYLKSGGQGEHTKSRHKIKKSHLLSVYLLMYY